MLKKAFRSVRLQLTQYVPDSGQEHTANGDEGFLVTTTSFDPTIAFSELRMLFGTKQSICDLNQKWFQIATGAGDPSGFHFAGALIIAGAASGPGNQILSRGED